MARDGQGYPRRRRDMMMMMMNNGSGKHQTGENEKKILKKTRNHAKTKCIAETALKG